MNPRFIDNDAAWWNQVKAAGMQDTEARGAYFKVVRDMFGPLGFAVRQVVSSELQLH